LQELTGAGLDRTAPEARAEVAVALWLVDDTAADRYLAAVDELLRPRRIPVTP